MLEKQPSVPNATEVSLRPTTEQKKAVRPSLYRSSDDFVQRFGALWHKILWPAAEVELTRRVVIDAHVVIERCEHFWECDGPILCRFAQSIS